MARQAELHRGSDHRAAPWIVLRFRTLLLEISHLLRRQSQIGDEARVSSRKKTDCSPLIRFLFVRPALCLRLPPDSQSPATPLPLG